MDDPAQEEDDSLRTNPTFLKASFLSAFVGWSVSAGWSVFVSTDFLRLPFSRRFFIETCGVWGASIAMMNVCTVRLCEAYNDAPTIRRLDQIKFWYIRPPFALTMVFGQPYAPTPPHGIWNSIGIWNFIGQTLFIIRKQTFYFVVIQILSFIVEVFLIDIVKVSLQLGLFSQRFIDCTKFYVTYFVCSPYFVGYLHSLLGFYSLVCFPGSLFFSGKISFVIRTYFFSLILIYFSTINSYFFALHAQRRCSPTEDLTKLCARSQGHLQSLQSVWP